MAVTFTPASVASGVTTHDVSDMQVLVGSIAFSGNYATGGDSLDFTALLNQNGVGVTDYVGANPVAGYILQYDYTNKKLKVYDTGASSGAALAELAAGAYPGALTGATGVGVLVFGR